MTLAWKGGGRLANDPGAEWGGCLANDPGVKGGGAWLMTLEGIAKNGGVPG